MEYKQILRGYYDTEKKVKAIDLLTDQPYFIEDRPDMKQRIERAINFKQLLAIYQRGTRNGFKYIEQNDFIQDTNIVGQNPTISLYWCVHTTLQILQFGRAGAGEQIAPILRGGAKPPRPPLLLKPTSVQTMRRLDCLLPILFKLLDVTTS